MFAHATFMIMPSGGSPDRGEHALHGIPAGGGYVNKKSRGRATPFPIGRLFGHEHFTLLIERYAFNMQG
jgi:hypothetical protein